MPAPLTPSSRDISYPFLSEVAAIRQRARQHIQRGAAAPAQLATTETVLRLLNEALSIELGRMCRNCGSSYVVGDAMVAGSEHRCLASTRAQHHPVDRIAARIAQLGGTPDFTADTFPGLQQSAHIEYESLADRIEEDLIAEHIAVESYADILHYLGGEDRVTRRLFEALLAKARRRLEKLACTRERLLPKAAAISAPET